MTRLRHCLPLLISLVASSITRAGFVEQDGDTTVIHVVLHNWMFPNPSKTDTPTRANAAAVNAFRKSFPDRFAKQYRERYQADPKTYGDFNWDNVRVQLHNFSGIRIPGMESDLLAIAGEVAPDVIYVNFRKSSTYIEEGFLAPLSQLMRDSRLPPTDNPILKRITQRDGETYMIPYGGMMAAVLLYRKDLFDQAGVAYPDANWTWEDMHRACRRIADPQRGIYAIRYKLGADAAWYWTPMLRGMGADLLRQDSGGKWQVAFNSREAAEALDFYITLNTEAWSDAEDRPQRGYAWRDASSAYELWTSGRIAMAQGYFEGDLMASINPDITGIAPVPLSPKGLRKGELNHRMLGLFSGIKQPAVRDAAWEFIRYFDSEEAQRIKTRVMVEGGMGRFVQPDLLEKFGYSEMVRLAPKGWVETYRIAFETGEPEPWYKHSNIAYSLLDPPLNDGIALGLAGELPEEREERLAVLQNMLGRAAAKAQVKMLGEVSPQTKWVQRITAFLFLLLVIAAFSIVLRVIFKAFSPLAKAGTKPNWEFRRCRSAYLLLLPAVLTILLWQYVPLLRGSVMAFQDYKLLGESKFIGLDNFGEVLWDTDWWASVWAALRYSLLIIALTFLPPVGLAILLQEVPRCKVLFRTIYYLPAVVTGLVLIYLWKSFYGESDAGALNTLLRKIPAAGYLLIGLGLFLICYLFSLRLHLHKSRLPGLLFFGAGLVLAWTCLKIPLPVMNLDHLSWSEKLFGIDVLPPRAWLTQPETAMLACVLPLIWAGMGPGCLIYLAALKGIPDAYYEAADIDGATFPDKILFIVFPILKPLLIINFVGVFIGSWFYSEANILAMTGGAAGTRVAGLEIFFQAFTLLKFGPATAMAWILGLLLIGFTMWQLRILARVEFKTTGGD